VSANLIIDQQRVLIRDILSARGLSQATFAKMIGRTEKHVSQVLTGKAGTAELDYWAFVLGYRFVIDMEEL
jgi:predicted transcriptional regulator